MSELSILAADAGDYCASVGDVTHYVDRSARRRGIGLALLTAIAGNTAA